MSISVNPKIKPSWKSLCDLGIEKYLISSRFEELCKDINIEGLWKQCIQHAEDEDFILYPRPCFKSRYFINSLFKISTITLRARRKCIICIV
jgi:hypothetical protein